MLEWLSMVNEQPLSQSTARVLVVEDEPDIADLLAHSLRREGFRVGVAMAGQQAVDEIRREMPDLVLLDLMLPDMNGLDFLKVLRRQEGGDRTRVIIVTARKDEIDRVLGFELGADDYVTKPFSTRELVLRIRSVLGRGKTEPGSDGTIVAAGPIEIDEALHQARVANRTLHLTLTEFRLLAELVRARGRILSRDLLLSKVWNYDTEVMSRTVDTHVRRLRSKLGPAAEWLSTVRGVGYRIRDPHAQS